MSWNQIDLGEWEKSEAGVDKEEELQNIRKNELADDWAEVVRVRNSVYRSENELSRIDEKLPKLKGRRKVLKEFPPEKPSFSDKLQDVFRSWKDSSMARYNASLDSAEEEMRTVSEEIKQLKERQDALVAKEKAAKSEYEELKRIYDVKADTIFEEKKPLLEKENETKKEKLEKMIEYLYNALHTEQLQSISNEFETRIQENVINSFSGELPPEDPEYPSYLTDTTERLAFIKKDLKDSDGHARELLFSTVDENEANNLIKDLVKDKK